MPFKKPPRPPSIMSGVRMRFATPFGHLHMTVTVDLKEDKEFEIFAQIGKCGEMTNADMEGMCRVSSLYLRAGGGMADVAEQLEGIGTNMSRTQGEIISVPDSLGRALKKYLEYKKKFGLRAMVLGEINVGDDDSIDIHSSEDAGGEEAGPAADAGPGGAPEKRNDRPVDGAVQA